MNCRLQFFSSFKENRGKNQLLFLVASSSSFWWWKREHCCWLMGRSTERSGWRTAYMVWEEKRRSWCPELEKKKKKRNSVDAKKSENSSSNDDVLCWGENAQIRRWTLYREREREHARRNVSNASSHGMRILQTSDSDASIIGMQLRLQNMCMVVC